MALIIWSLICWGGIAWLGLTNFLLLCITGMLALVFFGNY